MIGAIGWRAGARRARAAWLAAAVVAAIAVPHPLEAAAPTASAWRLSGARVMRPARPVEAGEGRMWVGYEIEVDAVSIGPGPRERATFRILVSAHAPARDTPRQKAGRWYIRGSWSMASATAKGPARQVWVDPRAIRGELAADLDFNPLERAGAINAVVRSGGVEAAGSFAGSEKFEGVLRLPSRPGPRGSQPQR